MSGERITREAPIQRLAARSTASGRDALADLITQTQRAIEASQVEAASDLLATLERHYPGEQAAGKLRRAFARAQARPLLNSVCRPDDVVRIGAPDEDIDQLPLKLAHRAVLEHVDGQLTASQLFDVVGLAPLEFAQAVVDLALFGALGFERAPASDKPPSTRRKN